MTYYYPYRYTNQSANSSSIANLAITASVTASTSTVINAAFYAPLAFASGSSGSIGVNATSASCAALNPGTQPPRGPSGSIGPSGSQGPALTSCPAGSIPCPNLAAPAGYSVVCIQTGSCAGIARCPGELPPPP